MNEVFLKLNNIYGEQLEQPLYSSKEHGVENADVVKDVEMWMMYVRR